MGPLLIRRRDASAALSIFVLVSVRDENIRR